MASVNRFALALSSDTPDEEDALARPCRRPSGAAPQRTVTTSTLTGKRKQRVQRVDPREECGTRMWEFVEFSASGMKCILAL